jgi:shikimate dehydrogenase
MARNKKFQLGLLGWPLSHSISPSIFNAAMLETGFPGEYHLLPVPPVPEGNEQLSEKLAQMRRGDLLGLNVTIPHKQVILPILDGLTDTARAIGAVNLIFRKDNLLIGDNSDAPAFRGDLSHFLSISIENQNPHNPGKHNSKQEGSGDQATTALVLGAGGAARAIVYILLQEGWQIIVASRRRTAAMQLVKDFEKHRKFAARQLKAITMDHNNLGAVADCRLIVNATPVGTISDKPSSPWPLDLPFPHGALIYDLVYNPPETLLIRAARDAGLVAISGLGMLVEQAALAFEHWTQILAPRSVMYAAARETLGLD